MMGDRSTGGCVNKSDRLEVGREAAESWENKEEKEIDGPDKEGKDEKVRDEVWDEEVDTE